MDWDKGCFLEFFEKHCQRNKVLELSSSNLEHTVLQLAPLQQASKINFKIVLPIL
jgi:hypothetical protein